MGSGGPTLRSSRYDEFLYISDTTVKLSLLFGFVLKNNTH
jgi:hypothetical protein